MNTRRVAMAAGAAMVCVAVAAAAAGIPAQSIPLRTGGDLMPSAGRHLAASATPPPCRIADAPTLFPAGLAELAVLDTSLRLPSGWKPARLVSIAAKTTLQSEAADAWRSLKAAAAKDRVSLYPVSAYRSQAYQESVFARNVRKHGRAHALAFVARPGHSEHQLGTTVDIGYSFGTAITSEPVSHPRSRNQKAASWLAAHGWKHGWVRSYPKGLQALTCYHSEPWHWRYVGKADAAAVHAQRITLRAYLWRLRQAR